MIEGKDKRQCVPIKDFNTLLSNHVIQSLQINGKQRIIMSKKGEHVKFKSYERKTKSPFMIYVDLCH